jgi:hypothetical protein
VEITKYSLQIFPLENKITVEMLIKNYLINFDIWKSPADKNYPCSASKIPYEIINFSIAFLQAILDHSALIQ